MSLGSVIAQVGEALGCAHALFGDPPGSGAAPAGGAGARLAAAGDLVRTGQQKMSALTGAAPASYTTLAGGTAIKLDALVAADDQLAGALDSAAGADRSGRSASGAVVNNAAATTAGMAPLTGTAAGQQALLKALRDRVARQQQIVAAYKARDARMAAILRSLSYSGRAQMPGAAGSPMGGGGAIPFGGGSGPSFGGAGTPLSALSAVPGLTNHRRRTRLAASRESAVAPLSVTGPQLGPLTLNSSPRQVAAAIIREAHRRGYSRAQTIPILAMFMQESGLNPQAVSPNGLWVGLAQQDSSYPGRANPITAISGFFDRLDGKGARESPDIWKSIFWLQQAPGASSALAAYSGGRRGYLTEIMSQSSTARQLFDSLTTA